MDRQDIKKELEKIGNIKVTFEPFLYKKDRIASKDIIDIIKKCSVSLRGWSFPYIPRQDNELSKQPYFIGDGIEFYINSDKFIELFRLYQSGQFLGNFALYEDTIGESNGNKIPSGKYLDYISIIYKVTEIVLFIKNLINNTDIEGGILNLEINKTKGRELQAIFSSNIISFGNYICNIDKIIIEESFTKEKIIEDSLVISRELIKKIFNNFNWMDYSDQVINSHQENLINRKF